MVEVVLEEEVEEVATFQEAEVLHKENKENQMIHEKSHFCIENEHWVYLKASE